MKCIVNSKILVANERNLLSKIKQQINEKERKTIAISKRRWKNIKILVALEMKILFMQ